MCKACNASLEDNVHFKWSHTCGLAGYRRLSKDEYGTYDGSSSSSPYENVFYCMDEYEDGWRPDGSGNNIYDGVTQWCRCCNRTIGLCTC